MLNFPGRAQIFVYTPATACVSLPSVSLPGGITISLGSQAEIAALIIDRLLQHAFNKAAAC